MRFLTQPIGRDRANYARGADFERKARDHFLHDKDATYVVRSAGSRGIVDLVVFFQAEDAVGSYQNESGYTRDHVIASPVVWLVQCKRDGKISDEDRELLCSLAAEVGAVPILAWPVKVGNRVYVESEQVSENVNATATDIRRG